MTRMFRNSAFRLTIRFVASQGNDLDTGCLFTEFINPLGGPIESLPVGNIVDYDGSMGTTVVHGSQTVVTFLTYIKEVPQRISIRQTE